jgi:hypothetical protein
MNEETYGTAPDGIDQAEWERLVCDEALNFAGFNGKFRGNTGANDALRWAKDQVRARLTGDQTKGQ